MTDEKLNRLRKAYENLQVCIIDEISMVGADRLYDVSRRLCEILINNDAFGGILCMCFGDICQLPPPNARKVFVQPRTKQNQALYNSNESLWNNFKSVVLKVNHRQGENNLWTECLNRIRVAEYLAQDDIALLETRRTRHFPDIDFEHDALHAFYTNEEVETVNNARLDELTTPLEINEATIESSEVYTPDIKPHGTIESTAFVKILKVKVGARVMLVWNVDILDSLVNGMTGEIIEILWHWVDKRRTSMKAVVVKFDNENVGQAARERFGHLSATIRNRGGTPIFFSTTEFNIPGKIIEMNKGFKY